MNHNTSRVLRALRVKIAEFHPDAIEVIRLGERTVSWGWGTKKMSEAYIYALPYRNYVNVGFYRGAFLTDPLGRLKGSGKALRHVSITHPDELDDSVLCTLIREARDERKKALQR
ncbi:DUF1801 domain-containing protein [Ochrobactrum sp. GPK 3]|uniref:DUF1801 domain-containing protein n=1 Tax=Brucella sp. 22210 TaxID=3453892 RepID=UPI00313856CD